MLLGVHYNIYSPPASIVPLFPPKDWLRGGTGGLALLFYSALAEWIRGPVPTVPPSHSEASAEESKPGDAVTSPGKILILRVG